MIRARVSVITAKRKTYASKEMVGITVKAEYPLEPFDGVGDEGEWADIEIDLPLDQAVEFYVGGWVHFEFNPGREKKEEAL